MHTRQQDLKKQSLQDKKIVNLAVDKKRNEDLDALKAMGVPFTTADAVDEYTAATDIDEGTKLVSTWWFRYARDTSLSLPKISDLFRLIKDHINVCCA